MKTILSHLRALLGRNENIFTGNFSLKSQMMIFLEEQMGVIFSTYSQALDVAPQLVSSNHLLENRALSKVIACFPAFAGTSAG